MRLWNVAARAEAQSLLGHTGTVTAVAFCRGGATVASASADGSTRLWNASSGAEERRFAAGELGVACSGDRLARRDDSGALVFEDLRSGARSFPIAEALSSLGAAAFSPGGDGFAASFRSAGGEQLELFDLAKGGARHLAPDPEHDVAAFAFSPAARLIAMAAGSAIRISNLSGERVATLAAASGVDAGAVIAEGPVPLVELVGRDRERAARLLVCKFGPLVFPFDLCRERVETAGLVHEVFAGVRPRRDP